MIMTVPYILSAWATLHNYEPMDRLHMDNEAHGQQVRRAREIQNKGLTNDTWCCMAIDRLLGSERDDPPVAIPLELAETGRPPQANSSGRQGDNQFWSSSFPGWEECCSTYDFRSSDQGPVCLSTCSSALNFKTTSFNSSFCHHDVQHQILL